MTCVVPEMKLIRRFCGAAWGAASHYAWTCDSFISPSHAQGSGHSSRVGARFIRRLS